MKTPLGLTIFRGVVVAAVVIVAGVGLWLGGAPSDERARRLDQQRLSDLDQISNTINGYSQSTDALPTDLSALVHNPNYSYLQSITDPASGAMYDYRMLGGLKYELCATFETDNTQDKPASSYPNPLLWQHHVGRTCFTLTATGIIKPNAPIPAPIVK